MGRGVFCFTRLHLVLACQVSTHSKTTKNQALSNRFAIYCDAPGYNVLAYVAEELVDD